MTEYAALDLVLDGLPDRYAGPGGAVAVVKDGKLLAQRSWGWADVYRRIPFTPQSLFRICSITKQFTCAAMLDAFPDPAVLDGDVRAMLPRLSEAAPRAVDLANNQSGLRDYWALAMLCGAPAEGMFGPDQARMLIERTASLQFRPGTRYSYCNQNFRLLGDIVAARTGTPFDALLRRRVFEPAGMGRALLAADTAMLPDGTVGYEGSVEAGFRPAVNHILWTGDAGIAASLEDMIAWECFIDATRDDDGGVYRRLSAPPHFIDGEPASYGLGLSHMMLMGRHATGHGGGLRGWRSFRFNLRAERLSVIVLFNHMADTRAAGLDLLAAVLGEPQLRVAAEPDTGWTGSFEEPETGIVVRLETLPDHHVNLWYGPGAETLDPVPGGEAVGGATRLRRMADGIWMDRRGDHQSTRLIPVHGTPSRDIAGTYHAPEPGADFTCAESGGVLYGAFSGFLGQGMMNALIPVGTDLWRLPCPRALDHAAPGDWTLRFRRDADGKVVGVTIGCWLARRVAFSRV
jgi:D-aminopeptidase